MEGVLAVAGEAEGDDRFVGLRRVGLFGVGDVVARERRVVLQREPAGLGGFVDLAVLFGGVFGDQDRALGDFDDDPVFGQFLAGRADVEVFLGELGAGQQLVLGVVGEEVEAGPGDRALFFAAVDRFLFRGELGGRVGGRVGAGDDQLLGLEAFGVPTGGFPFLFEGFERSRRRLLTGMGADHGLGADQVRLPVVEVELGGAADLFGGAVGIGDAGQADGDLVVAEAGHFGLGDAELVDPLFDDVDRVFDVFTGDRFTFVGRLTLVNELEAALEVEAELRFLDSDDDARGDHEPEHEQQNEEMPPPGTHGAYPSGVRTSRSPPSSS